MVLFISVCDMQTDTKTFHIKCMLEGALYKELGEEEYALQVSDQITPNRKCLIKQIVLLKL